MRWIVDENDPPIRGKGYTIQPFRVDDPFWESAA